eukprot:2596367-Prymnesium_polylepis.1
MEIEDLARAGRGVVGTQEVLFLAKLYDFTLQLQPPRRRQQGSHRCVALQRLVRREIEQSAHFDEVAAVWLDHLRHGDGYCAWPTLPGEPQPQPDSIER